MVSGTCDPASRGEAFNSGEFVQGPVSVAYRYTWDGTSVRPDCVGPLTRVTATNTSASETWYAHFKGRRGQWLRIEMAPGFNQTYNQTQLRNAGFQDNTDLENLYITVDPNPPAAAGFVKQ